MVIPNTIFFLDRLFTQLIMTKLSDYLNYLFFPIKLEIFPNLLIFLLIFFVIIVTDMLKKVSRLIIIDAGH